MSKIALVNALIAANADNVTGRLDTEATPPTGILTLDTSEGKAEITLEEFDAMYKGMVRLWPVVKPLKTELLGLQRDHAKTEKQAAREAAEAEKKAAREKEVAERKAKREQEAAEKKAAKEKAEKEAAAAKAKAEKEAKAKADKAAKAAAAKK